MNQMEAKSPKKIRLADLFDESVDEHSEFLRHKREDVAITLCDMLGAKSISRADLARRLDWKPSRITKALSGTANITINTLAEIVNAVGLDFDILVRQRCAVRAFQPWEQAKVGFELLDLHAQLTATLSEAEEHCNHAKEVLQTSQAINRLMFSRATQQYAGNKNPVLQKNYSYNEEDNAPIACEA